jgi:hypothetical protein
MRSTFQPGLRHSGIVVASTGMRRAAKAKAGLA